MINARLYTLIRGYIRNVTDIIIEEKICSDTNKIRLSGVAA